MELQEKKDLFYWFLDHVKSPNVTANIFPQAETCVYVREYEDHALILDELFNFLI